MEQDVPQPAPQEQVVNVLNSQGELVGLPASQAQQALNDSQSGYHPASQEDVSQFAKEQTYGTTGQQVLTGVEGAVSAGTMGLIPGLTSHALERREVNPGIHTIGQITGTALTNLIPGFGEFADIQEAATAAKAAVKAGTMAEEAATPILSAAKSSINPLSAQSIMSGTAEKAVQAMGLEGIKAHAMRGAIETAIFQGGDEIAKGILQDPNQSVQTAVTNIGLAGLLGAPTGAAFGKLSDLLESGNNKLAQTANDFSARIKEHLETPDPGSKLTEELTNRFNGDKAVFDEVYGAKGLKQDAIQKLMPAQLSDKMMGQAQDLLTQTKVLQKNMEMNPDLYPAYSRAALNRDLGILSDHLSEPAEPSQVFNALQDFKQRLGEALPQRGQIITKADSEFVKSGRDLYSKFRKGLEDPGIWGKAGDVQQRINKAFSDYLPAQKDFQRKFMTKVEGEYQLDPGKIQTYVNQTGKAGQKLKQDMLGNWMEATENYRNAIHKTHENLGIQSPLEPSSLNYAKSTLQELTPGAKLADVFVKKGLSRLSGEALGAAVGGGAGHLVGAGGFGALIGEHMLGPFFSSILPSLIKPMLENPASGSGLKSAIQMGLNVIRGESIVNKSVSGLFKAGQEILPTKLIPDEKVIRKLDKNLEKFRDNPQQLMKPPGNKGHYLPDHATAEAQYKANAVTYLNSQRPGLQKNAPLDQEIKPNPIQKAAFDRTLEIAEQPLIVLGHIKDGTLTPKDIIDFNALNPQLHERLVQKLTNEMAEHLSEENEIPYHVRMGLSMFMGEPLDSTMTPQGIQSAQAIFLMPPTPQQQQGIRKVAQNSFKKLSGMDQTPLETRMSERNQ